MIYDTVLMLLGFAVHTGLTYTSQRKFKSVTMSQHIAQNRVAFITSVLAIIAFALVGGDTMAAMITQYFPVPEGRRVAMFIVGFSINSVLKKLENVTMVKKVPRT